MTGKDLLERALRQRFGADDRVPCNACHSHSPIPTSCAGPSGGTSARSRSIVRAYETPVFNYVYRLTGDRSLAEDLTQEVFVRVFNGLPRFSLRCKFTTWLFQVTKNRVLDELRARERRPQAVVNLDDMPHARVIRPADRADARRSTRSGAPCEELNPDLKMALLLRDVVGLPYNEIADSLEITLATVKWRIFKAREEVQLILARDGITFAEPARRTDPRLSAAGAH